MPAADLPARSDSSIGARLRIDIRRVTSRSGRPVVSPWPSGKRPASPAASHIAPIVAGVGVTASSSTQIAACFCRASHDSAAARCCSAGVAASSRSSRRVWALAASAAHAGATMVSPPSRPALNSAAPASACRSRIESAGSADQTRARATRHRACWVSSIASSSRRSIGATRAEASTSPERSNSGVIGPTRSSVRACSPVVASTARQRRVGSAKAGSSSASRSGRSRQLSGSGLAQGLVSALALGSSASSSNPNRAASSSGRGSHRSAIGRPSSQISCPITPSGRSTRTNHASESVSARAVRGVTTDHVGPRSSQRTGPGGGGVSRMAATSPSTSRPSGNRRVTAEGGRLPRSGRTAMTRGRPGIAS